MNLPTVTLYGHPYCHLCADMQRELEALSSSLRFELELVDIAGDPELEARFGELVPVLYCAAERICHYFLDHERLEAALERARFEPR